MTKILKTVCLTVVLTLVLSLAMLPVILGNKSPAVAQSGGVSVCQMQTFDIMTGGTWPGYIEADFSVPRTATVPATLKVGIQGKFDPYFNAYFVNVWDNEASYDFYERVWSENGRCDPSGFSYQSEPDDPQPWSLADKIGASGVSNWAGDGTISVKVYNQVRWSVEPPCGEGLDNYEVTLCYTVPPPEITGICPTCITELNSCEDSNWIYIYGENFLDGATVTVGGVAPAVTNFISSQEIRVCIGSESGLSYGTCDVIVTNPSGGIYGDPQDPAVLSDTFTYAESCPGPVISSISPSCIEELDSCKDGNWVTVYGDNFNSDARVTVECAEEYTVTDYVSSTQLCFCVDQSSELPYGTYDVTVTNPGCAPNGNHVERQAALLEDSSYTLENALTYAESCCCADFTGSPTRGEAPLRVYFTGEVCGDLTVSSWSWDFGDGGTGSVQNPVHIYTNPGRYTVTLTYGCSPGVEPVVREFYITVLEALPAEEETIIPKIVVRNLNISATHAQPRQAVAINADVINEGGRWESATIDLMINGKFEQSVSVGVAPGTAQPVSFTVYKIDAGEYTVNVEGAAGTFYVMEEPASSPATPIGNIPLDTGGTVAIIVVAVILVGGVVVVFLLARPG